MEIFYYYHSVGDEMRVNILEKLARFLIIGPSVPRSPKQRLWKPRNNADMINEREGYLLVPF